MSLTLRPWAKIRRLEAELRLAKAELMEDEYAASNRQERMRSLENRYRKLELDYMKLKSECDSHTLRRRGIRHDLLAMRMHRNEIRAERDLLRTKVQRLEHRQEYDHGVQLTCAYNDGFDAGRADALKGETK